MDKIIKVKITEGYIPSHYVVSNFKGQVLEVVEVSDDSEFYRIADPSKYSEGDFTMDKAYTTIVEEPFKFKSGMTFKTNHGEYGVVVGTDKNLVGMFYDKKSGKVVSFAREADLYSYLSDESPYFGGTMIQEVYIGMNSFENAALSANIGTVGNKVLWKRKVTKTVKLNDDYTAVIKGDEVVVGCQTIPMEKIREIVKLADED